MERGADAAEIQVLVVRLGEGPPAATMDDEGGSLVGVVEGALATRADASVTQAVAKVGADAVILALGSAGAITAAVEALRLWLARDRRRSVQLSWTVGGHHREVVLAADKLSEAGARELLLAALSQPGVSDDGPAPPATGGLEDG
jgi:hypothetical protein